MERLLMNGKERSRLMVLNTVKAGELTLTRAAVVLEVSLLMSAATCREMRRQIVCATWIGAPGERFNVFLKKYTVVRNGWLLS